MRLLMIHGRAQGGKDPGQLKETWLETLQVGLDKIGAPSDALARISVDFPFYGDALDAFTAGVTATPPKAKGPDEDTAFDLFFRQAISEMAAHVPEKMIEDEMSDATTTKKGFKNWEWVHAAASAIDLKFTGFSEWTIEKALRDVFLYVHSKNADVRDDIDKIIEAELTDEPTVVVGHSLGSVVGYNILTKHNQSTDFKKFVTVGAPLGIKAIANHLGVIDNPVPNNWFNAYDDRDVVALNPLDKINFDVSPPIDNYSEVKNHTDNRHGIVGYLDDPRVAGHILNSLDL